MQASPSDLAAACALLGRPPRALQGVAVRCPHGGPAVLAQRPYDEDGTPFPTPYWLACRALVEAVGRLENAGGVAEFERLLADDPELRADRDAAEARARARRARLAPVDGPRRDGGAALAASFSGGPPGGGLKCLHAHAAAALADPRYRLGALVLERADVRYPERCCRGW